MPESASLEHDLELLRRLSGQVLAEQVGSEVVALYQQLLRLAVQRRGGDPAAGDALVAQLAALDHGRVRQIARALTHDFDLANLAEDRQRVRELRRRERASHPAPRPESVAEAVGLLAQAGWSAAQMQALLDSLCLERVFTAHPTEAKRRSGRAKLRDIRRLLSALDNPDVLPREAERLEGELLAHITGMWQTDLLRARRPTVLEEVRNGLFFAETLWEVLPLLYRDLAAALAAAWPGHTFTLPAFVGAASWIGGDRDGNPFVTADVTAEALALHRRAALELHLAQCRRAEIMVSQSTHQVGAAPSLVAALEAAAARWPELGPLLEPYSPRELARRWLRVIAWRLECALAAPSVDQPQLPGAYARHGELVADLELLVDSVSQCGGQRTADAELVDWLWRARTCGLHLLRLDCRQNTRVLREVMGAVFQHLGVCDHYEQLSERERRHLLNQSLPWHSWMPAEALPCDALPAQAQETLKLFSLLSRAARLFGPEVLGPFVISMTHELSDVLSVVWLSRWAGMGLRAGEPSPLEVVPLFETLDDLRDAAGIFEAMLDHAVLRRQIREQGNQQLVMIGYSDSTKDAGFLAANWALYRAQTELQQVAARHAVRVIFFHGRGGGLGRGGGPAARSIISLPPETVAGGLRVTEQGEVLAERYDDPRVAHRHLEQVVGAVLQVAGGAAPGPRAQFTVALNDLAADALAAYRALLQRDDFLDYFAHATPIEVIEGMPIGSRPSHRSGQRSLADLRAIPWAFAWTQSRQLLPAWYGLGAALATAEDALLQRMYAEWPFFAAMIDNAGLALSMVDPGIVARYAALADSPALGGVIAAEYELAVTGVGRANGTGRLLPTAAWLEQAIAARSPRVDVLNLIQVEALRRRRALDPAADPAEAAGLESLLRLTIQGIASGLRSTG